MPPNSNAAPPWRDAARLRGFARNARTFGACDKRAGRADIPPVLATNPREIERAQGASAATRYTQRTEAEDALDTPAIKAR